jgi:cytosine/uracil/thiamine/allantoin permease
MEGWLMLESSYELPWWYYEQQMTVSLMIRRFGALALAIGVLIEDEFVQNPKQQK